MEAFLAVEPRTGLVWAALLAAAVMVVYLAFRLRFERWKTVYTRDVRRDAVQRSQATTIGLVSEQLVPYFPQFKWNPKDAKFLGKPVDFIVFDGLDEENVRAIVFVEVKTGSSALTPRERLLRDAIKQGRVEWFELRLPDLQRASE